MRADFKAPAIEKELRLVITTSRLTDELFWNAMNAALLPRLPKVLLQDTCSRCTANCTVPRLKLVIRSCMYHRR